LEPEKIVIVINDRRKGQASKQKRKKKEKHEFAFDIGDMRDVAAAFMMAMSIILRWIIV